MLADIMEGDGGKWMDRLWKRLEALLRSADETFLSERGGGGASSSSAASSSSLSSSISRLPFLFNDEATDPKGLGRLRGRGAGGGLGKAAVTGKGKSKRGGRGGEGRDAADDDGGGGEVEGEIVHDLTRNLSGSHKGRMYRGRLAMLLA